MPFDRSDAHKLKRVLRLRQGDCIEVIDSGGSRFCASLQMDGPNVGATLTGALSSSQSAFPNVTVAQAIPKGQKMDFVVEKLTELGAARIVPLLSQRVVAAASGANKRDRWRRLAKTAAQQCGRADIPQIDEPVPYDRLLQAFGQYDCVLFPWELCDGPPLRQSLPPLLERANTVLVAIGPEGGFTHAEADAARTAGAHVVSLGRRIFRTETAALVVLAIIGYISG